MASAKAVVRPLVVAAHPHNNSLVVLLHGILSSRFRAWEPVIDMVQRLYDDGERTAVFGSYDYYAFGYRSGLVQPPFEDYFDQLRELVSRDRYDTVVLIGHSQGGVLAKRFLIDERDKGRLDRSKVDLVVTLDTPHRGPQWWIYPGVLTGAIWKRLPVLGRKPLLRQLADLGRWSPASRRLAREWNAANFPMDPCPPQPRRRHVKSFTVQGTRLPIPFLRPKAVVGVRSAEGFENDVPFDDDGMTAWGLGHGIAAMARFRMRIEALLAEHGQPALDELCAEVRRLDAAAIADAVRGGCEEADLPCEVQIWLRRLQVGFSTRPLRGLPSAPEAAARFIGIRRQHP